MGVCNVEDTQIVFVDTPGFIREGSSPWAEQFIDATLWALDNVDVILLVVDASNPKRLGTEKILHQFAKQKNFLVAINKIDTRYRSKLYPVAQEIKDAGYEDEIFLTSARDLSGIEDLKKGLLSRAVEREWEYESNDDVSIPKELYAAEAVREKAFYCLKDEIPFGLTTSAASWDFREGRPWRADVDIIVQKDSQKRIVIGSQGQMIKKIGVTARTELECIWGKGQLFLNVVVG
jgi:GTP-binding protein Era